MTVTAKLNYLRIAPRKVRLVADLIRGKKVEEAKTRLQFLPQKSAQPLKKLLNSAIANAKNNFQLQENNLYISKLLVDEGPKLKRWRARARGQGYEIQKKTSHITIVLDEVEKKIREEKKVPSTAVVKRKTQKEEIKKSDATEEKKKGKAPMIKPKFRADSEWKKSRIGKGIPKIFRRKSI